MPVCQGRTGRIGIFGADTGCLRSLRGLSVWVTYPRTGLVSISHNPFEFQELTSGGVRADSENVGSSWDGFSCEKKSPEER